MGCDIHCYIEYRAQTRNLDNPSWYGFGGRINPGRNYDAFAALAGVRGPQPDGLVKPRGVPNNMAYQADGNYWMTVVDYAVTRADDGDGRMSDNALNLMAVSLAHPDDDTIRGALLDALQEERELVRTGRNVTFRIGTCTSKEAARYEKNGSRVNMVNGHKFVEHPDWHTPTWLLHEEWTTALKKARVLRREEPEYWAMADAMRGLDHAGNDVRVVFWFDN